MLSLSQTTVSRALNGYPEVNEETRRRVIDAAKRHGYRPNPSARRLATGKAGMIGYVMPTGDSVDIDPHFVEFLSGLGDYARAHELDLVLSPTDGRRGGDDLSPHRRQQAGRRGLRLVAAAGRPAHRAAQPARHPLSSCMAAPRGWISTIPISTSTMRAPSTTRRGCCVQLGHRRRRADQRRRSPRPSPSTASAACAGRWPRAGWRLRRAPCLLGRDDRGERLSRRARACSSSSERADRDRLLRHDHGAGRRARDARARPRPFPATCR